MQWTNKIANKLFFSRSIKNADIIWANSNYTKNKIMRYFPYRKSKEIFVGAAVNNKYFKVQNMPLSEEIILKKEFGIKQDFILFVYRMNLMLFVVFQSSDVTSIFLGMAT